METQPKRSHHLDKGFQFGVSLAGEGPIKGFWVQSCLFRDFGHALCPCDGTKSGGNHLRVTIFKSGFKERGLALLRVQIGRGVIRGGYRFHRTGWMGCTRGSGGSGFAGIHEIPLYRVLANLMAV